MRLDQQTNSLPQNHTNQLTKARIRILLDHASAIDCSHLSIGIRAGEWSSPAAQLGRALIGQSIAAMTVVCFNRASRTIS